MKKGSLVISLDFELIWGVFDHVELQDKITYFNNTLKAIPEILSIFEKNSIHVTWASVGMLFNENWEQWFSNFPQELPTYENTALNPYEYGKKHQKSGLDHYFFAPQIIKDIQSIKGQEIGTHTYSHYYCLEKGQNSYQFESDIQKAVEIAKIAGVELKSLVFPRNQFNQGYLDVCYKNNIQTVRTNPTAWYWDTNKPNSLTTKIVRSSDAYLPLGKKSYPESDIEAGLVVGQMASRFLRPQHTLDLLNKARLLRIKNEIRNAAKLGEVYHLWWHPHNFGLDSAGALKALKSIIAEFAYCREKYGMQSQTMQEMGSPYLKK